LARVLTNQHSTVIERIIKRQNSQHKKMSKWFVKKLKKNIQLTIDIPSEHCALYSTTAPTVDSSAFFYVLYDDAKYTSTSIVHFYFNRAVSVQCTLHIILFFLYKLKLLGSDYCLMVVYK